MGCDIHTAVEVKKNGAWEFTGPVFPPEAWLLAIQCVKPDELTHEVYSVRNYLAFGVLAGVRVEVEPIAKPRGYPPDATEETREALETDHRHHRSHYSLRELLSHDWVKEEELVGKWGSRRLTHAEMCETFLREALPKLVNLADPHVLYWAEKAVAGDKTALAPMHDWLEENGRPGLDDVRMVFSFDN